jgi:hypothetical protein
MPIESGVYRYPCGCVGYGPKQGELQDGYYVWDIWCLLPCSEDVKFGKIRAQQSKFGDGVAAALSGTELSEIFRTLQQMSESASKYDQIRCLLI